MNVCTRARISSRIARAREIGSSRRSSRSHRSARGSGPATRAGSSRGGASSGGRDAERHDVGRFRASRGSIARGETPSEVHPDFLHARDDHGMHACRWGEPGRVARACVLSTRWLNQACAICEQARVVGANEDDGMHGAHATTARHGVQARRAITRVDRASALVRWRLAGSKGALRKTRPFHTGGRHRRGGA